MSNVESFEYVFLGGGKGGKTLAMELARAGRRVAVVERGMIGGSCINVACIPSKALIHEAGLARLANRQADMPRVADYVRSVVDGMVEINHQALLGSGLELVIGSGRFVGPRRLEVTTADGATRTLEGEHAFINTGTVAQIPEIPGLRDAQPLTHVEALRLDTLPDHLIVLGGGYIGLEMAQAFARLGSRVTVVHDGARVALREDEDVSAAIEAAFSAEGIAIRKGARAAGVSGTSGQAVTLRLDDGGSVTGSHLLVATGRTPLTRDIGLAAAGVELDARGFVKVDERLATSAPNTWAIGEVAGTPMFTHASYDDYRVLKSQLAGGTRTTRERTIPYALFIEPELARIGLNEQDAKAAGIAVRVAKLPMSAVPKARTAGATQGFMKIVVEAASDRILGFTMLGLHAGDVMTAVQMAMLGGLPYTAVRDAIIAHPLMSEGLNILLNAVPAREAR